jgi:antitoxin component of RelBE/YafQ-DinJ toxin-antitoxin module
VTGQWFSLGTPVSSTIKTGRQDITEIGLKVVLNTINQTINLTGLPMNMTIYSTNKKIYKYLKSLHNNTKCIT